MWGAMGSPTARLPLNRATVVGAARDLIEDEGLDAVSFRRLAQRLGVTAPALYAYVSDKDDLLRSVTATELRSLIGNFDRPEGEHPVESLRRYCHRYVGYAVAHPALYRTMFQYPPWDADTDHTHVGLPLTLSEFAVPWQAVVDALDQGLLRRENPLMVTLMLWTAVHGLAEVLLMGIPGGDELRRDFTDAVIDSAIDGLRRPQPSP
jgi:AcrR family transcriptional regulator